MDIRHVGLQEAHEPALCLCRQAALYEKLSATAADDDEERYNVDFLRKGLLSDEAPSAPSTQPLDTAFDALGQGGVSLLFHGC
jgi:hypothetical protein